jgi:ribosomal protein S18 acetylase RimI-like enzyme
VVGSKAGPGEVNVRDFVPSDRPFLERGLLADLREAAPFDPLKMFVPPRNWGRTYSTFLLKEVRRTHGHILVAELGSKRAGFLVGVVERPSRGQPRSFAARRPCWIYDLYVEPAFRNRGVGRKLIGEVERRFRAKGRDFVNLLALSGNDRAVALYRSSGYVPRVFLLGKWLIKPDHPFRALVETR